MKRLARKLLAVVSLGAVLLSSCAATLRLSATAPIQDDDRATCTATPILTARTGFTRMHFAWVGAVSGQDSLTTTAGTLVNFVRTGIPAGLYTVRAWASDSAGVSCDTTITLQLGGPPAKVRDLR